MLQLQKYIENCLQGNVTCEMYQTQTELDANILTSLPSNAIQVTTVEDVKNNLQKEFIYISYMESNADRLIMRYGDYKIHLCSTFMLDADDDTGDSYNININYNTLYKFTLYSNIYNGYFPLTASFTFNRNDTYFKLYYLPDEPTTYTVTINANGGTGTSTLTDKTEITTDDLATIKTQITRDGYILTGLSETSTGSVVTLPYTLTADKTMYCVWTTPDNLQTKAEKLLTYAKSQLSAKNVTSTATTLRDALDDIANISTGGTQAQLNAPTISLNGSILTLTNPATNGGFAQGFNIYNGSALLATQPIDATTLDLSTLVTVEGTYTFTAKCYGTNMSISNASESVSYVVSNGYSITVVASGTYAIEAYEGVWEEPTAGTINGTLLGTVEAGTSQTFTLTTGKFAYDTSAPYIADVTITGSITYSAFRSYIVTGTATIDVEAIYD